MGEQRVNASFSEADLRSFTLALLRDMEAFEMMLKGDLFERDVRRMGVEQEMFLVDNKPPHRPAAVATEVLENLDDDTFTTELARFNLEANIPPRRLEGDFLSALHSDLTNAIDRVATSASSRGARVALTGILPTLRWRDLTIANMTPTERYRRLNQALKRLRRGRFRIFIRGLDLFDETSDNVMLEAANCSLQLHLQVAPDEFARLYNRAQLISAPLLAAASNSPLLLGRRLWHETRVALFEGSVDARSASETTRGLPPRVCFGNDWVHEGVLELFRQAVLRFRVLLTCEPQGDPVKQLHEGTLPRLAALSLHNGTIWRWNRPCYGLKDGKAHLRIENRVLPAGPTICDEVANAALYYGLMSTPAEELAAETTMSFDAAKDNFLAAARQGLDAVFNWIDGRKSTARDLLLEELLPLARRGLHDCGVPEEQIEHQIGIIEARVDRRRTGSRWMLESLAARADAKREAALDNMSTALIELQDSGEPVHRWPVTARGEQRSSIIHNPTVRALMSKDLFTVRPQDAVDLATNLMRWQRVRHVPVESDGGEIVGVISVTSLMKVPTSNSEEEGRPIAVAEIMDPNPVLVDPETSIPDAIAALLDSPQSCLLVTSKKKLIGIVTERDLLEGALSLTSEPRETA